MALFDIKDDIENVVQPKKKKKVRAKTTTKPSSVFTPTLVEETPKSFAKKTKQRERERKAVKKALRPIRPAWAEPHKKTYGPAASPARSKPKKQDLLPLAVETQVIQPQIKAGHLPKSKTLGQKIYQRVAEWGPVVLTGAPELKAGAEGLKAVLKGIQSGETKLGGTALTKPFKATTPAQQRVVTKRLSEKAAESGAKKVARRAVGATGRADRAAIRRITKTQTRREAATPAAIPAKVSASQSLPLVRGHEQALVESPGKTAKTTARLLPGLVTVPVGMAAHVGVSGGRAGSEALHEIGVPGFKGYSGKEILAPLKGEAEAQIEFAKQVASVVTSDDSAYVQKQVENNLGLLLPLMAGLGTKAALDKFGKGRVTAGVRRLAEKARRSEHGEFRGKQPRVFERAGQHRESAVLAANTKTLIRRRTADATREARAHAGKAKGKSEIRTVVRDRKTPTGKKQRPVTIRTADWANFLTRHSIPLGDQARALAEVRRISGTIKDLPKGVRLNPSDIHTRDVIADIVAHPERLSDPELRAVVAAYKREAAYRRKHADELSPEHSERARFLPTAVSRDRPLPEEIHPTSIRDVVRSEPTRGKRSKDVLKREARRDRSRARALRQKAQRLEAKERGAKREAAIRARGIEPRLKRVVDRKARITRLQAREARLSHKLTRARTTKTRGQYRAALARVRATRERLEAVNTGSPARTHIEARASVYGGRADLARQRAERAEAMAKRKQKAASEIDPAVETEFVEGMTETLQNEGLPLPEFTPTSRARQLKPMSGVKLSAVPGKSKFRKGTAEEYGMVQEDFPTLMREGFARPIARVESYKAMRRMLEDNEYREGRKSEFSEHEANELFDSGTLNRNQYVAIPRQAYKRSYTPEEWAAQMKLALDQDTGKVKGDNLKLVRRHAADQFFRQMGAEHVFKNLSKFNRATAYLILGTSPAWAAMQVLAEYSQAAIAQPKLLNPAFIKKANAAYKEMSPKERQEFESWVGVTTRVLESPNDLKLGLKTGDMEAAAGTYGRMNTTPYGKFLKAIPNSIRNIDQWKGGRIRALTTIAKVDKDLNSKTNRFLRGVGGLYREGERVSKELQGKPLKEQLEFVAKHPEWAKKYQGYLDDVMGNWSALTSNERMASQVLIFYPFLRMSLRWTLRTFPKRHPIKAAMLAYLGQQNANEVAKLLHGDPSYFTQWAQVPLHLGDGETQLIDLSRIAPGSNAIVEALGETKSPFTAALRTLQPGWASLITAATGVNPLTGKQEDNYVANAFASLMSLSPVSRVADKALVSGGEQRAEGSLPIVGSTERQNSLDKLFAKLKETGSVADYARTLAAPVIPKNVEHEADIALLGRTLDTLTAMKERRESLAQEAGAGQIPEAKAEKEAIKASRASDKAQATLDRLFRKYKIPYKKEEERFSKAYGNVYYAEPEESDLPDLNEPIGGSLPDLSEPVK